MKQVIVGGSINCFDVTTTEYNTVSGGNIWAIATDDTKQVVTTPGTLSNLLVELSLAPGDGKSFTITLMKNDVAQGLAVTISDGAITGLDTSSVAVLAGDIIQLRCAPSGTPQVGVTAEWSILFEGTNAKESILLGITRTSVISTYYCPITHTSPVATTTENEAYQVISTSGKIKNLYVELTADPGTSPNAYRFMLRKNGGDTVLTVTITADATTGNNTADEITVAAGDYVNLMIEPLSDPSSGPTAWFGFTFVADTDGESLLLGGSSNTPEPSLNPTTYNYLVSTYGYSPIWITTEAFRYQGGQPMMLKKLYVKLSAAPGAGKNYLIGARVNGTTRLSVTIADGAQTGNDLANTWDIANYDELNMICTPSGTPAETMVYWSLVGYIEPPAPPAAVGGSGSLAAAAQLLLG